MAARAFLGVLLLLSSSTLLALCQNTNFTFNGFNSTTTSLELDGASVIKPSGALKLTNTSADYIGHAFYSEQIQMFDSGSTSNRGVSSFSTHFVFAIKPGELDKAGGYGLAFVIAPVNKFPYAEAEHFLGLFNSSNDGNEANHMLVVEFDTVKGHEELSDSEGNHVGINLNGMTSKYYQPAAYYVNDTDNKGEIKLESGDPIQAWIEYNASTGSLNVSIAPINVEKPRKALLSVVENLTSTLLEKMYVGFSASTGNKRSFHYVLGWSFQLNGPAPPLNMAKLPLPPVVDSSSSPPYRAPVIALIVGLCVFTVCLVGALIFFTVAHKRRRRECLEEWEVDCPHRFNYKDLHTATKGFSDTEKLGVGGFGAVYRGVLPTNRCEVAVKKIMSNNALQGMREFVAEVESLGRLRHKNLVNLQGWCKQKNELLLVYDYVPYGSLHSLLYNRTDNGFVLSWNQRLHIIKGIAAGLVYLHEEWEQVVVHRDVKSSNVLIDSDMNGRLGDFGLARLYDHGQMSHVTNVVGTVGYIAPELARSGKASASSDVFAYGILLLEVVTGKHPIGSSHFVLADWVLGCYEQGKTLDVVDPRMNSAYHAEEVELLVQLGLLCSHPKDESRPRMRQVVRYLNKEDPFPPYESSHSTRADPITSRFLEAMSSDVNTSSFISSSTGGFSAASLSGGR